MTLPSDRAPELPIWARPRAAHEPPLVALGAMNFGKRTPEPEARRIVARALERGVRVYDTANAYNDGESERILGLALRERRGEVCIATKVGFGRVGGKPEGLAPERVRAALAESLRRLGTDHVDLYYLHVPDHGTPVEDTLGAISALLEAGSVRSFGVSNYASWQILEIMNCCDRRSMPRPVVAQQIYNLLIRQLDLEYFGFAKKYAVHTTVYNPLAGGLLSGRYKSGDDVAKGSRFDNNRLYMGRYWTPLMIAHAEAFHELARDEGISLVELAYRWLAGAPGVDSILVGPGSLAHLDAALDAIQRPLSEDARKRVDQRHRAHVGTETSYAR